MKIVCAVIKLSVLCHHAVCEGRECVHTRNYVVGAFSDQGNYEGESKDHERRRSQFLSQVSHCQTKICGEFGRNFRAQLFDQVK